MMGGRGYSGATNRRSASLEKQIATANAKLQDYDSAYAAAAVAADEKDREYDTEEYRQYGIFPMTEQERRDYIEDKHEEILMDKGYSISQILDMERIAAQRKFNQNELDRLNHGQFALFNVNTGSTKKEAPKTQSLDEYLGERGLRSPISDYMVDKTKIPHGMTQRQKDKLVRDASNASKDYQARRNAAISEYNSLVSSGKVKAPTWLEKSLKTAQGHEDNSAVQAARRVLTKRGYDWKTGKKL